MNLRRDEVMKFIGARLGLEIAKGVRIAVGLMLSFV